MEGVSPHYSRALDEIYRLRMALAVEAAGLDTILEFRTLPQSARKLLEDMRERLRLGARGVDLHPDVSSEAKDAALRAAGAPVTLTRHQWETGERNR